MMEIPIYCVNEVCDGNLVSYSMTILVFAGLRNGSIALKSPLAAPIEVLMVTPAREDGKMIAFFTFVIE